MKKILAIGEIIWDVYPDKSVIGGAPLNFAAHAALCGAHSTLVSSVGRDALGDEAIRIVGDFGVDCRYVKKNEHPTGQCLVTLSENAVPSYNVLRGVAYDNIELAENDIVGINSDGYDAFYFGTLIQREPVSREAVRRILRECKFGEIICDVNLRPDCFDRESVRLCLENATILKVSLEEEPTLRSFGLYTPADGSPSAVAHALCESFANIGLVIVTLGAEGSYAYNARDGREYVQSAVGDTVVSTVGAGDSFAAAFLVSYLEGESVEVCMRRAAERSGYVVAHTEAVPK